jgi:hypothetical protein
LVEMAFPKHRLLGVRIAIAKQNFKGVRKELMKRVCPKMGEHTKYIARKARLALLKMGFPVTPFTPAGHGGIPPSHQAMEPALAKQACQVEQPDPSAQLLPGPAIGGKNVAQAEATPAIGEANLATKCPFAVQVANEMGQGSAQPDCSNAPALRTVPLAPWTFHREQDVCFKATEELGQGAFGKVLGVTLGPHGHAAALKLLSRR